MMIGWIEGAKLKRHRDKRRENAPVSLFSEPVSVFG